jgi:hypothetical protein
MCTYLPYVYIFVLLMGKQAVCCEVRIGPLDVIQNNFISERRAMAQAVSHWSATAENWVRSRGKPFEFYVGQSGTGTVFSPSICFSCLPVLPTYLSINVTVTRKTSGRNPTEVESNFCSFGYWELLDRKLPLHCSCLKGYIWLMAGSILLIDLIYTIC